MGIDATGTWVLLHATTAIAAVATKSKKLPDLLRKRLKQVFMLNQVKWKGVNLQFVKDNKKNLN